MNLNAEDEAEAVFTQHCLELAKLLRTEQTERFLRLYDSLPSEWTASRLEAAKESIRQLQELDANDFEHLYQRAFRHPEQQQQQQQANPSATAMSKQPTVTRADDNHGESTGPGSSRITSLAILQHKQHLERTTANNLACDEQHDLTPKHSSTQKQHDDSNSKPRPHPLPTTNSRTHTPVDSFVQLNLKPAMEISLQDYKKARVSTPTTKPSSTGTRSPLGQSHDASSMTRKHPKSLEDQYHEEASLDYFFKKDEDDRQQSRSSSSSPSSAAKPNAAHAPKSTPSAREHSKLIANNHFDSHGSSVATKSSSENSGSARTGSGSDSDDEHHPLPAGKKPTVFSTNSLFKNDATPTMVLPKTVTNSFNRTAAVKITSLPPKYHDSSCLLSMVDMPDLFRIRPRPLIMYLYYKLSDTSSYTSNGDPNGNSQSSNQILSYTTQRPQTANLASSSQSNQNSERHDQYNAHHSNTSRKSASRASKKRKQLQQQETIRTELIPGHRGDLDVDELVMFIDGSSSSKQRTNAVPLRLTDTNSNSASTTAARRKSRKSIKGAQESSPTANNENKSARADDDTHSVGFVDEDDETAMTSDAKPAYTSLSNDDESHSSAIDIGSPNTTNGEISAPEWLEPTRSTSSTNDDHDSLSLASATLNNSNSEIASEPFVTVTHRRRLTKDRRQDSNPSTGRTTYYPTSSNANDKRRFQPAPPPPSSSVQNGASRPMVRNGYSHPKPFGSIPTREESTSLPFQSTSTAPPPPQQPLPPPASTSSNLTEQLSPRLSSHSSSSSIASSQKRPSKPPPVVFLNKSEDVELNDVSFGFDMEHPPAEEPTPNARFSPPLPAPSEIEKEAEHLASLQLNGSSADSDATSSRRAQQRTPRESTFYADADIRSQPQHAHNRVYPTSTSTVTPGYIDPVLLLQYNQQRFAASYPQHIAYMNFMRPPFVSPQSPYVLIPAAYPTTNEIARDENKPDDETGPAPDHVQEPLLVYATIPTQLGSVYLPPGKKGVNDADPQVPVQAMYPPPYFYPPVMPNTAYFQPITSPSFVAEDKSQQNDTDDEANDHDYQKSTRLAQQTRQQSSSHIMSNALQLVYSQERRSAQTDRFNLDQLTAYLSMKWIDAVDHYEQGDDQIVLTGE